MSTSKKTANNQDAFKDILYRSQRLTARLDKNIPLIHRPLSLIHSCTQQMLSKNGIPISMDTKSIEELAIKMTKAPPKKATDRFMREVEDRLPGFG